MIAVFFWGVKVMSECSGKIKYEDVQRLCEFFEGDKDGVESFCKKIILKKDNVLSLVQFCRVLYERPDKWKRIYRFRIDLVDKVFPNFYYIKILQRKYTLSGSVLYQSEKKLPKLTCVERLTIIYKGLPNWYEYDYEPNDELSYSTIVENFIRKYNPNVFVLKETFNYKYFRIKSEPVLQQIDNFYDASKKCSTNKAKSVLSPSTSVYSQDSSSTPGSILKISHCETTRAYCFTDRYSSAGKSFEFKMCSTKVYPYPPQELENE